MRTFVQGHFRFTNVRLENSSPRAVGDGIVLGDRLYELEYGVSLEGLGGNGGLYSDKGETFGIMSTFLSAEAERYFVGDGGKWPTLDALLSVDCGLEMVGLIAISSDRVFKLEFLTASCGRDGSLAAFTLGSCTSEPGTSDPRPSSSPGQATFP